MLLQLSIAFTFLAVICWRNSTHSRKFAAFISFLVFSSLFLVGFYYFADVFSGDGVNQAVLYHISGNNMVGVAGEAFQFIIGLIVAFLVALLFIAFVVYKSVRTTYPLNKHKLQVGTAFALLLGALLINPATQDVYGLYSNSDGIAGAKIPETFIKIAKLEGAEKPKNLVYLYLESMERSYFDPEVFPGLLPKLQQRENQALSFTNIHQAYGTGWTIAGMAASQCGVAFVTPFKTDKNSMFGVDNFMPRAQCLGDLLHPEDYSLHFMKGSLLSFAGVGNFYKTHNFTEVNGWEHYYKKFQGVIEKNHWGLYDDILLEQAKQKYDALTKQEKPFGLFLVTVDSHNPGYPSPSCEKTYQADDNPVLNAVHCSDDLVVDFIDHILTSDKFKDTVLVVASDHYAMPFSNPAWDKLEQTERRNLLMMFAKGQGPKLIDKPGSTLDVAPTILNLLGYKIQGLGFGRSLLSEQSILFSDIKTFDDFLQEHNGFLKSLWFPAKENKETDI